ncbi:MAG TPA: helix-turn-helix domain-containing protein [Holophaga sp.]|nr:helix-turn-helix domain-containing protein [Holophaga sp.]
MSERLWFKIGETAARIGATPKELRYWEKVIPELRPRRSKGNLRYYHVDELPRLQKIRGWLSEGLTVADCRQLLLHGQLTRPLLELEPEESAEVMEPKPHRRVAPKERHADLEPVIKALKALAGRLSRPPQAGMPPEAEA